MIEVNGNPRVLVLYQGEWGGVDPQRRAIRSREIPGGVARGPIPGSSGSTLSGVPTVPGKIPDGMASRPTPAGQQSGVVSSISSSIPGQVVVFVYNRG